MLQLRFINVQFSFLLFFNLCTVYFSKKCSFFSNIIITVHKCSVFFSFFFSSIYVLSKKCPFFLSFFSICRVQQCSSFFSFFFLCLFSIVLYLFLFVFCFPFFSLFFFHNKLLIHCPSFFFPTLYLPLTVFTLTQ